MISGSGDRLGEVGDGRDFILRFFDGFFFNVCMFCFGNYLVRFLCFLYVYFMFLFFV